MTPNDEGNHQPSSLDTSTMELVLDGRYRLDTEIMRGRMGNVYKGTDLKYNRAVAVKIMRPFLNENYQFLSAFDKESALLAGLDHPNIVRILDAKLADQNPHKLTYLVMEYVKGIPLDQYLDENESRLDLGDLFDTFLNIAEAIDFIHQNKIVHRNLKSENILVRSFDGVPKLVDFGFGYLSDLILEDGKTCFNPAFASPEQCLGEEAEPSSDIYSFATTIYYSLGKDFPYIGSNHSQFIAAKTNDPPLSLKKRNTAWPPEFCAILNRALAVSPKERPINCRLFVEDLRKSMTRRIDRPLVRYLSRSTSYIGTPVPLEGEVEKDAFGELPSSRPLAQSVRLRQAQSSSSSLTPLPVHLPKKPRRRWTAKILTLSIIALLGSGLSLLIFPDHTRNALEKIGVDTYDSKITWVFPERQIDFTGEKFEDIGVLFASLKEQLESNLKRSIRQNSSFIQNRNGEIVSSPEASTLEFLLPNIEGEWELKYAENQGMSSEIRTTESGQQLLIRWSDNISEHNRRQRSELHFNNQTVVNLVFTQEPEFYIQVAEATTHEPIEGNLIELDRVAPTGSIHLMTNALNPDELHFSTSYFSPSNIKSPDWLELEIKEIDNPTSDISIYNASWSLKDNGDLCSEQTGSLVVHSSLPPVTFYLPAQEQLFRVEVIEPRNIFEGKRLDKLPSEGGEFVVATASGGGCSGIAPKKVGSPVEWLDLTWEPREFDGEYFLIANVYPQSSIQTRRADIVFNESLISDQQSFSLVQDGKPCFPEFLWAENNRASLVDVSSSAQQLVIKINNRECLELSLDQDFTISADSHESFQSKKISDMIGIFRDDLIFTLPSNRSSDERLLNIHFRDISVLTLKQDGLNSSNPVVAGSTNKPVPTPRPTSTPVPVSSNREELKSILDNLDARSTLTIADVKIYRNRMQRIVGYQKLSDTDSSLISKIEERLAVLSGNTVADQLPIQQSGSKWLVNSIDLEKLQFVLSSTAQPIPIESMRVSEFIQLEFNQQTVSALVKCNWRTSTETRSSSDVSIIEFDVMTNQRTSSAKVFSIPELLNDPVIRFAAMGSESFLLMSKSSFAVLQPRGLERLQVDMGQPYQLIDLAPIGNDQFLFLASNNINPTQQTVGILAHSKPTSELFLQDYSPLSGNFYKVIPTANSRSIWLTDGDALYRAQNALAQQEFGWIIPGMPIQQTIRPEPFEIGRNWRSRSVIASTYSGYLFLHEGNQTPIQINNTQLPSDEMSFVEVSSEMKFRNQDAMTANGEGDLVMSDGNEITILFQPRQSVSFLSRSD